MVQSDCPLHLLLSIYIGDVTSPNLIPLIFFRIGMFLIIIDISIKFRERLIKI